VEWSVLVHERNYIYDRNPLESWEDFRAKNTPND
jgi:hypothetical protein